MKKIIKCVYTEGFRSIGIVKCLENIFEKNVLYKSFKWRISNVILNSVVKVVIITLKFLNRNLHFFHIYVYQKIGSI